MRIIEQKINALGIIIIKVAYNADEARAIAKWCNQQRCGKQVAIQQYAFKQEEFTMFKLRWENT